MNHLNKVLTNLSIFCITTRLAQNTQEFKFSINMTIC